LFYKPEVVAMAAAGVVVVLFFLQVPKYEYLKDETYSAPCTFYVGPFRLARRKLRQF